MRDHLRAELATSALMMAIQRQRPEPGLIQHSDRGVQYACTDYQRVLQAANIQPSIKVPRGIYEGARDMAREIAETDAYVVSRREWKNVEMPFAHLKRIVGLDRLRLRVPCGTRDEFLLAAPAQNLRKLIKLLPLSQPATG